VTCKNCHNMLNFGRIAVLVFLILATGDNLYGEEMDVPVAQQFSIFMKILECNRGFETHDDSVLTFGIIYQSGNKQSLNTRDELMEIISKSPRIIINKIPVKFMAIDLSHATDLAGTITGSKIDIVYITPLRACNIEDLAALFAAHRVLSFTGLPSYLESGLAVSIANRGGKPQIVINLPASKSEGVSFSSQVLKLARVIE
jgi:hypothetical protein